MDFIAQYDPSRNSLEDGYWFLFRKGGLVVRGAEGRDPDILKRELRFRDPALEDMGSRVRRAHYFGTLGKISCFTGEVDSDGEFTPGFSSVDLRKLFGKIPVDFMTAARFAAHLLHWDRNARYCGCCGSPNRDKEDERAKICPSCGNISYPRLSPAVIVAILDGKRILLAHNKRFMAPVYSLIAGFVEMGEDLETCVAREVEEEVGVKVKNIRYFGSQPWPFPDSLMAGFIADYAGREVRVDTKELVDAKWFSPPDMPNLPPSDSIARRILTWYEQEYLPGLDPKGS